MSIQDDILKHKILSARLEPTLIKIYKEKLRTVQNKIYYATSDKSRKHVISNAMLKAQIAILDFLTKFSEHVKKVITKILEKFGLIAKQEAVKFVSVKAKEVLIKYSTTENPFSIDKAFSKFDTYTSKIITQSVKDAKIKDATNPESFSVKKGVLFKGSVKSYVDEAIKSRILPASGVMLSSMINAVASDSQKEVYEEHKIDLFIWSAILDASTCEDCESYSNLPPFALEDAPDTIPVHSNCRCELIPAN